MGGPDAPDCNARGEAAAREGGPPRASRERAGSEVASARARRDPARQEVGIVELTDRRRFLLTSLAGALAARAAEAQQAAKVYRVGILGDKASDANETVRWQTFRAGLRERGWNEGVNIRIENRWVEGNAARLPELAADLVRLKPDLIATYGSFFTGALKAATSSIPLARTARSALFAGRARRPCSSRTATHNRGLSGRCHRKGNTGGRIRVLRRVLARDRSRGVVDLANST
jgi:hypothetical protein